MACSWEARSVSSAADYNLWVLVCDVSIARTKVTAAESVSASKSTKTIFPALAQLAWA
jgi:hypothetical protein